MWGTRLWGRVLVVFATTKGLYELFMKEASEARVRTEPHFMSACA